MSLRLWLPLNGDLHNQGLDEFQPTATNYNVIDNGKIGKCVIRKTTSSGIDTGFSGSKWNINETSLTFAGWFKFPRQEITELINSIEYTSTYYSTGMTILGHISYSGVALYTTSNNIYSSGSFSGLNVFCTIRQNSSLVSSSMYSLPFDTWVHLCGVFDRENTKMSLYVNGQLITTKSIGYTPSECALGTFKICHGQINGGNLRTPNLPVYCNDVRIYDNCLSPKEIKELSKGLVLHYPLTRTQDLIFEDMVAIKDEDGNNLIEETSDDAILEEYSSDWKDSFLNIEYDVSGYQRNGINYGTTYSSDTIRYLTCTSFNGITDGVVISNLNISNILNDQCTISFWIKPDGENGARSVYFSAYNSTSWSIEKNTSNKLRLYWNGNPDISTTLSISDGEWQHIVITKNGTSDVKVYLNGELIQSLTNTHSNLTFGTTWRLGRDTRSNDGTPYKGLMSDFRIYSTALDADDILALYHTPASIASNGTLLTQGEISEV